MKRHILAFPGTDGLGSFQDTRPVCDSDKYEDVVWGFISSTFGNGFDAMAIVQ